MPNYPFMKPCLLVIFIFFVALGATGQDFETDLGMASEPPRPGLPEVSFDYDNPLLMKAFYPELYANEYRLSRDIRFVPGNDSAFMADWDLYGYTILALLEDYAGISWQESRLEINLMRYLPVDVLYDPASFPFEGIRTRSFIEAAPTGFHRILNLTKLLAGRLLIQGELPGHRRVGIERHPLMDKSAYRLDLLVLTLTLTAAEEIFPPDTLNEILSSHSWERHNPGWSVFKEHFRPNWRLNRSNPLITYLEREPYDSRLVRITRPPRIDKPEQGDSGADKIRLTAGGGILGMAVNKLGSGRLEIVDLDSAGLATSSGLMKGDQITRVNGDRPRHARDLMGKILDALSGGGAYLSIVRQGQDHGVLIMPD